jgi:chemotaxis protein MotB
MFDKFLSNRNVIRETMARPKAAENKIDTNSWMTTYTDLMTLLLTFFVLLLSLSVMDSRKKREALNSLVGAFGFKPGAQSVIGSDKGLNVTVGSAPLTEEEIRFERLQNISFKNGLESEMVVTKEGERIIITLSNKVLFKPEADEIDQSRLPFLTELAAVLREVPRLVELRGYADPTEMLLDPEDFKKRMMLSSRRAHALYLFFGSKGGVEPGKMVAHGFGTVPPKRASPGMKEGFNRQVEIICDYRTKIPRTLRDGERSKGFLLDFKGFLFGLENHGNGRKP